MKISRNDILLVWVVVVTTLVIKGCFTKVQKPEQMIRNEERIKYLEKERIEDSIVWVKREAAIDSLLAISYQRYEQLENKKQPLIIRYDKIPSDINKLGKDSIRILITHF